MPSLSFQPNLIKAVLSGKKPGTVRQVRTHPLVGGRLIKPGDTLYLFTGIRTKNCKRHGTATCIKTYNIEIDVEHKRIKLDGVELIPIIRYWFATTDINGTEQEFFDFFEKQNYQKPLVWIVWDQDTVNMVDAWLRDQRAFTSVRDSFISNLGAFWPH